MEQFVQNRILINASPTAVWGYLTDPSLIGEWMGDPEMKIEIITNWEVGNPIVIRAFHHVQF